MKISEGIRQMVVGRYRISLRSKVRVPSTTYLHVQCHPDGEVRHFAALVAHCSLKLCLRSDHLCRAQEVAVHSSNGTSAIVAANRIALLLIVAPSRWKKALRSYKVGDLLADVPSLAR